MIETFSSHHTFSLSLDYTSVGGIKTLNIPSALGYTSNDVVTLSEALAINSIKAMCWIESLDEVQLPDIQITDSRQQQAIKIMETQWSSPRKQLDLFLIKNNSNSLISSTAVINSSGFQYTQFDLLESLDPDNKYFILGNDTDLAVQIQDAGYGLLTGDDKINIIVTVEKKTTVLYKTSAIVIPPTNQNQAPTNITLSNNSIDENVPPGTNIGSLSNTGGTGATTYVYSFVDGIGGEDNSQFTISGNNLMINSSPDYELKSSYNIKVKVTDNNNLSFTKAFTILVTDIQEQVTPSYINLYANNENILNTPTASVDASLTINGVTASNNLLVFDSSSSIVLLNNATYDLNQNFEFTWFMNVTDFYENHYIFDTRGASGIGSPVIYLDSDGLINLYSGGFTLQVQPTAINNVECSFKRIDGVATLKIGSDEISGNTGIAMATAQITIGQSYLGSGGFVGEINNFKLYIW
ncbi:cadherin repeat domain-containing protein [Sphaerospermopsis aphanizomenoides BCCUSP55]|uniref:cadherin repeat domain-containing protein n=1 Tax=Sphaerospermopsis aphanizomenoides TaxID=459663 RepID=UPI00190530A2|nr:cadherin repeat domain-containing protein [Sphaerospermopsis aphanizomenoides]MBK1987287.1 cadherin repeat domain-containing protein [Sphaerospermopsis aphanizomenoides BCCUSP55]